MQHPIILVDEQDHEVGYGEKLDVHRQALLHRAFSVFIYRHQPAGIEILLQQRQHDKYHCGGLWTNTCCSHPRPGETVVAAAQRRLYEEMGLKIPLTAVGHFIYKAAFANGLTEHELDHVMVGHYDGSALKIDAEEVAAYQWKNLDELLRELEQPAPQYTPWLKPALMLAKAHFVR
jgi:isopentenyl-diphosphate delta-isomerase type 1